MIIDPYYPSVDLSFIEDKINKSGWVIPNSQRKVGKTTMFVLTGTQPIHKRLILVRELEAGQVTYEQATGIAIKLGFLSEVMEWLRINKQWVEGAFTLTSQN